ncbi:unnamed protein product [Kuraishia capsulata CBS 1993]|uniref:Kinase n=1 Tax=Kuraishia capsulata CBS 1993 TaxID=1382522 RepID=W6MV41_9ASCO|nr:uncharacterized protein KUCA_T00005750001 [Kuraishia capsulata CBS 1993]CDK29757.1 unnamed protein product [Kuraishia capsulata CBS 1993]
MSDFIPFPHQAAGHPGSLQSVDGSLFLKATTKQEIAFYEGLNAQEDNPDTDLGSKLLHWTPTFMGTLTLGATPDVVKKGNIDAEMMATVQSQSGSVDELTSKEYLVLRNALYGYSQPSVLDVKLGSILYDENTSSEKVQRLSEVSKNTTSGSLNFRVCGMKIRHNQIPSDLEGVRMDDCTSLLKEEGSDIITFDKTFGRSLTNETVTKGLGLFFRHNRLPVNVQQKILEIFHLRLQILYNCLLDEEVRIRSGSLFFVFENDLSRWEQLEYDDPVIEEEFWEEEDDDDDDDENKTPVARLSALKVIDFAHSKFVPGKGYDENVVKGVENLMSCFERLIREAEKSESTRTL